MKIILNKKNISKFIDNKKKVGFVPTMGGIHKGHISLIKRSIKQCNETIVSIFINEQQFNKKNDFNKYPRTLYKDISRLKKLKINVLYIPRNKEIYPKGYNRKIKINSFSKKLCGKSRPGHFEGVVDVIDRFIKIIKPNNLYLGEKDMQQLKILEDFIKKNHPICNVVGCKTIREKDGVPYSSRNFLLKNKDKKIASKVFQIVKTNKLNLIKKKNSIKYIKNKIHSLGISKIDYIKLLNINRIIRPYKKQINYRIFIAYYLKKVRLIDNI